MLSLWLLSLRLQLQLQLLSLWRLSLWLQLRIQRLSLLRISLWLQLPIQRLWLRLLWLRRLSLLLQLQIQLLLLQRQPSSPSVRASRLRRLPRLAAFDLLIGLLVCHPPNEVVELGILVVRD